MTTPQELRASLLAHASARTKLLIHYRTRDERSACAIGRVTAIAAECVYVLPDGIERAASIWIGRIDSVEVVK